MKTKDMTCPKCGAVMKTDDKKENAICEYCGYHVIFAHHVAQNETVITQNSQKGKGGVFAICIIAVFILIGTIFCFSEEMTKPEINPFDYIEVSFEGKNGKGEVSIETKPGDEGIHTGEIRFDISKESALSQGETIRIQATSESYRLSESERVFQVEGLDEYLSDLENIPREALELIHKKSESVLDMNLDTCKDAGVFTDMKPVKIFLATDGKYENCLYDVFEAYFSVDGEDKTFYVVASFSDVIVREGEQVTLDMTYGVYEGHLTQIKSWMWIMAYESVDEVKTDILTSQEKNMKLTELDL